MASIDQIRASDGSGNANVATVQSSRSPLASTIIVDTVVGINATFMGSMGTPHTFVDPITSEEIIVISEETCVDFSGHVDGSNLEIDDIAPGYTDLGSEVGDIVIIRPTSQWGDNLADVLDVSHEDTGDLKEDAILSALDSKGVLGATNYYTSSTTWTKPVGLKFVIVEAVGSGGGGGANDSGSTNNGAGGGGGGSYATVKKLAASLGATETVTIGAGGAAATNGNDSSFGAHCIGKGGTKGANGSGGAGGAGGVAGTGDFKVPGGQGSTGGAATPYGGAGGGTRYGQGAPARLDGGVADPGGLYGGGGAGGARIASGGRAGAAGAAGVVIVREYY